MGAQLVGRAYAYASRVHLKPNEFRLLAFMALTALDADNPPRYFASRGQSAMALGRMVSDDPKDPESAAAFQRVKEAIAGLIAAGAITRLKRGREGQRAEFALILPGTEFVRLESTEHVHLASTEYVRQGGRNAYPQGANQEPHEEPRPTTTSRVVSISREPVDRSNMREMAVAR